jgi:hypothetical protein
MKAIDIFLRIAIVVVFIGSFFLPDRTRFALIFGMFLAVGLWAVLYPSGVIGWAKTAYSELDPTDERLWGISRFIGVFFIAFSVLIPLIMFFHSK